MGGRREEEEVGGFLATYRLQRRRKEIERERERADLEVSPLFSFLSRVGVSLKTQQTFTHQKSGDY